MRVLILYDHPLWAQAHHAEGLRKYAPHWCRVETCEIAQQHTVCDVMYCINLASVGQKRVKRLVSCVASHAWTYPALDPHDWRTRAVNPSRNSIRGAMHLKWLDAAVCRNRSLARWAETYCKAAVHPAGIDPEVFYPCEKPHRKLRVGWCGQATPDRDGDVKGYHEILVPLMRRLGDRYEFEANTRTADQARSQSEMAEWFRSLDVFLCTSSNDGTPNPPFQAAACGAIVISTDIGQVTDWDALRALDLIVPTYRNASEAEQTIAAIADRLERLESDRRTTRDSLLESIERTYDYRVVAPKTLEFICGV